MNIDDLFSPKDQKIDKKHSILSLFEEKTPLPPTKKLPVLTEFVENLQISKTFGPYEVIDEIARGAMGIIYRVRHVSTQQIFALKAINTSSGIEPELIRRFQREIEIIMKLNHPGLIQVFDFGEQNREQYYVMELLTGKSLHEMIDQLEMEESVKITQNILEALLYIHLQGVIHRDIKPPNIFITETGQPKLGDFGIAKNLFDMNDDLTKSGMLMGTPFYMAPEMFMGKRSDVTPQSDIYAVGACLYEMLTGQCPYEGKSLFEIINNIRMKPLVPPSHWNVAIPVKLEKIVIKALEKDKNLRYASAHLFAEELRTFLENTSPLPKK